MPTRASGRFGSIMGMPIDRLLKFGAVGVAGSAVYYALLLVLVEWIGLPVLLSTSIAFVLVVLQQYLFHHGWTYRSDRPHASALPEYAVMATVGFGINLLIMYAGVDLLGGNYLLVQLVAIAAVIAWNFLWTNSVIFRTRV